MGVTPTPRRLTPIHFEKPLSDSTEYSVSHEVPLAEIRRQNDVERWRNKLRLQEKFQVNFIAKIIQRKSRFLFYLAAIICSK